MIVELGLMALHEPGVIRGRRQLRKHGIAWIMGGVEGDIQMGQQGTPSRERAALPQFVRTGKAQ